MFQHFVCKGRCRGYAVRRTFMRKLALAVAFFMSSVAVWACDLQGMLKNPSHPDWHRAACLDDLSKFLNKKKLSDSEQAVVVAAMRNLDSFIRGQLQKGNQAYAKKLSESMIALAPVTGVEYAVQKLDTSGNPVSETIKKAVSQQEVLPGMTAAQANEVFSADKSLEEISDSAQLLTYAASQGKMEPFIRYIVRSYSNPSLSTHINPDLVSMAFIYYAESLPPEKAADLIRYLDSSYDRFIRLSAAQAAMIFSKTRVAADGKSHILNEPAGKFNFSAAQRRTLLKVTALVYQSSEDSLRREILARQMGRIYEDSKWQLETVDVRAMAKAETSGWDQIASMVLVLRASPPVAGQAARSGVGTVFPSAGFTTAAAGGVAVGTVWLAVESLDESLTPIYKKRFEDGLFDALFPSVEEPTLAPEVFSVEDDKFGELYAFSVWTDDMARFGNAALSRTDAAAKTKNKKPHPTCKYMYTYNERKWRLDKLDSYVNPGDAPSKTRLAVLRQCLGRTWYCPARLPKEGGIFSNCKAENIIMMSPFLTACNKDIKELVAVRNVARSFYDSANPAEGNLYTRAIYRYGQWVPETEVGIVAPSRKNNLPTRVKDLFFDEIWRKIGDGNVLREFDAPFPLGGDAVFRNGKHEQSRRYEYDPNTGKMGRYQGGNPAYRHIHYEEKKAYPKANPYICNHVIYYSVP